MLPQMFLISVCHCNRINNALTTLTNIATLVITSDEHVNAPYLTISFHYFYRNQSYMYI